MEYSSNQDKMMQAVLADKDLTTFGQYTYADIGNIYQALDSDNYVVGAVARIIYRTENDGASERELWREINDYLKRNV